MSSRSPRRKRRVRARAERRNPRSLGGDPRGVPGLGRTFLGGLLPGQVGGHLLLWDVIGLSRLSRSRRTGGWSGAGMWQDRSSEILSTIGLPGGYAELPVSGPVAGGGAYIGNPPVEFFPNSPPPTTLLPPTPETYFPPASDYVPDVPTYGPTPDSGRGSSLPADLETYLSPEQIRTIYESFNHPYNRKIRPKTAQNRKKIRSGDRGRDPQNRLQKVRRNRKFRRIFSQIFFPVDRKSRRP